MSRNNSDNGPIDLTSSQETQHNEQVQAQQAWQNANVKYHQQSMMMSEGNSEVPNDCQQQQSECGVGPYYTTQCQNQMNQIQHPQNYCQNQCHLPIQNPHMNSFISPQTDTSQPLRLPCAQFCIIGPYQSCEQLIEHQTQLQWNGVSNATTGTSHCSEYQQASLQSHSECQSRINDQHDIEDITSGCAARNKRASVKQTREPQSTTKKRFRIPIHQKLKVSNSNTASTVTVTSSQQVPIKIQQTEQSKVQPKNPWVKKKISPAEVVTSNSPPYYGRNLILDNHQQQYPNSDFKFSKYHRNRENFFFQGLSQEAQIQYQKFQRNQQQEIEFEPSVASDSLPDHSEVPAKASISDSNWKSRTLQDSVKIFNKSLLSLKDKFGKQRSSQSTGSASTMMSPNKVESSENISTTNLSTAVDCNTLSTTLSQSDSPGDGPSQESFSVYQSEESHSITNSGTCINSENSNNYGSTSFLKTIKSRENSKFQLGERVRPFNRPQINESDDHELAQTTPTSPAIFKFNHQCYFSFNSDIRANFLNKLQQVCQVRMSESDVTSDSSESSLIPKALDNDNHSNLDNLSLMQEKNYFKNPKNRYQYVIEGIITSIRTKLPALSPKDLKKTATQSKTATNEYEYLVQWLIPGNSGYSTKSEDHHPHHSPFRKWMDEDQIAKIIVR